MAVTTYWFGEAAYGLVSATAARRFDWVNDTIKVALTTSTWAVDQDTMNFYDDVTNELGTATGYTAGGATLTSPALTYDTGSNTVRMDGADVSWTFTASKTMRYAPVYKDTGTPATSPLIGYVDFGSDQTSSGVFTIQWDATDGVFRMVVS